MITFFENLKILALYNICKNFLIKNLNMKKLNNKCTIYISTKNSYLKV